MTPPDEDDKIQELVESASMPAIRLADLYRKAKQRGLIQPHAQYT